jgi:hypothetical protein
MSHQTPHSGNDATQDLNLESSAGISAHSVVDDHDLSDTFIDDDAEFAERLDDGNDPLWIGDQGTLAARQRDTVVALLKKSFISSDDRDAWRTLIQDRDPIGVALNNLYMILVVDERAEVAYATPARNADHPFKTLVRDAPNSREETLLLIYLRERHRAETASGQAVAYVDADGMLAHVARFRPLTATDVYLDENRVRGAIAGLVTSGLLVKTRDEDRYRIHRAIEALLPLATLKQLLDAFQQHTATPDSAADGTTHGSTDGGVDADLTDPDPAAAPLAAAAQETSA